MTFKKIRWPEGEPVPRSPEEAGRLGWEKDQFTHFDIAKGRGAVRFWKTIDDVVLLRFEIPFTATLAYESPCEMGATKHSKCPTRDKLWDVLVENGFFGAKRTIRILARDADEAYNIACDISTDEHTHWARKPDHKRRKVYNNLESFQSDRKRREARA